jgi:RNA polymerase sigma-70 factor, ECF subfamily
VKRIAAGGIPWTKEDRMERAQQSPQRAIIPGGHLLPDDELVRRVVAGERALFEVLMRRHNPRVYHAVRSILRDEGEVEDAMQQTYLLAYAHLADFAGAASFTTWLTRIALNEALARVRRPSRLVAVGEAGLPEDTVTPPPETPEDRAAAHEASRLLERCIGRLPAMYRSVVMLRDVDQLTTAEAAEALGITEETVRIRLHRARAALRRAVAGELAETAGEAFPFYAPRCDRVVAFVMSALPAR